MFQGNAVTTAARKSSKKVDCWRVANFRGIVPVAYEVADRWRGRPEVACKWSRSAISPEEELPRCNVRVAQDCLPFHRGPPKELRARMGLLVALSVFGSPGPSFFIANLLYSSHRYVNHD